MIDDFAANHEEVNEIEGVPEDLEQMKSNLAESYKQNVASVVGTMHKEILYLKKENQKLQEANDVLANRIKELNAVVDEQRMAVQTLELQNIFTAEPQPLDEVPLFIWRETGIFDLQHELKMNTDLKVDPGLKIKHKEYVDSWYSGQYNQGNKPHGWGRKLYKDGYIYEGEWKNGIRNGFCKFIWVDGNYYQGDFKDSTMHGFGTMTWNDGVTYEGEWEEGEPHGKGQKWDKNGEKIKRGLWHRGNFLEEIDETEYFSKSFTHKERGQPTPP